jgi:hypothetical protein
MQNKKGKKRSIIRTVIGHQIIQYERKKQKQNPKKTQEKSPSKGSKPRQTVDVLVLIKNGIEQKPAQGNQQNARPKIRIVGNSYSSAAFLQGFAEYKKNAPSAHGAGNIRHFIDQNVPLPAMSHFFQHG